MWITSIVAEVRFELTTCALWAHRAATALLRYKEKATYLAAFPHLVSAPFLPIWLKNFFPFFLRVAFPIRLATIAYASRSFFDNFFLAI